MRGVSRPTRPFPVADRMADGTPITAYHPRLKAVEFLQVKIADKQAGLDPYDPSIFIVHAREFEKHAAGAFLNCVGEILGRFDLPDGTQRLRAVIEADVRLELDLDGVKPPLMEDEPLASRAVADEEWVFDSRPVVVALREAKAAYDRRYPDGIDKEAS